MAQQTKETLAEIFNKTLESVQKHAEHRKSHDNREADDFVAVCIPARKVSA
jgi:hypothetical protein